MFTTLRAKVLLGFLFIVLLIIALGSYAISSFRSLADITADALEQNSGLSIATSEMYQSIVQIDAAELRLLGEISESEAKESELILNEEPAKFYLALQQSWQAQKTLAPVVRDTMSILLNEIEDRWNHYQAHIDQFSTLARREQRRARTLYDKELSKESRELRELNYSVAAQNFLAISNARADAVERARSSTFGVILVTLVAVALGLIGSYLIARRTVEPLRKLTDSVKQLQAGNLEARIPISGADEIGDLGYEFNRLSERLQQFEAMNINEILREKQKSEAIIESLDDPLLLFDAEGRLLLMNRAAEDITGITEQTALGRPLWQLFRERMLLEDIERALEVAAKSIKGEEAPPPIVSIQRRGRSRYFRLHVARIAESGEMRRDPFEVSKANAVTKPLVGVLVFFNDITHFKELDKMKSDFIAKVSHEFRTPLTSMTMSLDILGAELIGKLNTDQHEIIDTSKQDAKRLAKLIRDLLTLARLESARLGGDQTEETVDVLEASDQLVKSLRAMYQQKGVALQAELPAPVKLRMGREHLVSIETNLLSNALKHTPEGGSVTLGVRYDREQHRLTIRVSDTGTGIAPEDQKRIFEKFVQIKPTNTSTPGSVGLGLAIVTEIANRYQGKVELASSVGEGSTFTVTLVADEATADGAQQSSAQAILQEVARTPHSGDQA